MKTHVLCTGGAGYIGSHCVLKLLENNYLVTILDNLANTSAKIIDRLETISNQKLTFVQLDLRDKEALFELFERSRFDAVVHFAALKAVEESIKLPLKYYDCNLIGSINLLQAMKKYACKTLVFSSSATVYKFQQKLLTEQDEVSPCNVYGKTKLMTEQIVQDVVASDKSFKATILRYFNPIGAHPSGLIGETANEPTNLLPIILQVAVQKRSHVNVFGNDWDTPDGTGVRDYIHVDDLADGHVVALTNLLKSKRDVNCQIYNLGTGKGISVLEMISHVEKASGQKIHYKFVERRLGDLSSVVADASKAAKEFNWKAKRSIDEACASAWKWQSQNPLGL